MSPNRLIFDPTQFQEFGLNFYKIDGFSIRYQLFKRLFWKNVYIPFGPICENIESFKAFLEYLNTFKLTKVKIDLPLILDTNTQAKISELLLKSGYKKSEYVQDEETLLVNQSNFGLNSRNMRYVRQGLKNYSIEVKSEINSKELDQIYNIYLDSAAQIGFTAKPIEAFKQILQKNITAVAYNKINNNIEGFLMGYKNEFLIDGIILQLIFTGLNAEARKNKLGFALHYELFQKSFSEFGIKTIDFHGASRTKGRSYTAFKENFGGEFVKYPGSFEKINLL